MKLSAPWITFYRELEALFREDKEVRVAYDEEAREVRIYVDNNQTKADALTALLPEEKEFGSVTVKVAVIPSNTGNMSGPELISRAFDCNPILNRIQVVESPVGKFSYVVFKKRVVQFYNDELSDLNGVRSTLYQEIAKDVFRPEFGLCYCTETEDDRLKKPLGEWP